MIRWLVIFCFCLFVQGIASGQTLTVTWPDPSTMPARIGAEGSLEAGVYLSTQGQESATRVRIWNADAAIRILQTDYDHLALGLSIRDQRVGSLFRNQQLAAGIAYRRELGDQRATIRQVIGAGAQLGLFHLNMESGNWIFSSQFNDQLYQFDPTINALENLNGVNWSSNVQPVVNAGLFYQAFVGRWSIMLIPSVAALNTPSLNMDGWSYEIPAQMQFLGQVEYQHTSQVILGTEWWFTRLAHFTDLQAQGFIRIGRQEREETTFQIGGILGLNRDPYGLQLMHGGFQARIRWRDHLVGLRLEDALTRINRWGTRMIIQYQFILSDQY